MILAGTLSLLWGSAAVLAVALGEPGSCGPAARLDFAELADKYKGKNSFPVGSIVKYVCRPGYHKLPGLNHSSTCLQSQKWSKVQEFCQKRRCGYPGEPENGQLIGSEDLLLGSTVEFICNEGHRLIGQSSRKCVVEDQRVMWTGDIPICQLTSCSSPEIANGKIVAGASDTYAYNQKVVFDCKDGYRLVGSRESHCQADGTWDPPLPICERGKYDINCE
ncbi:Complement decay-accelerating factor [Varanus komodoensis]|nr:Complement decay-accelerating factor [Varanus komodoensis]